MDEDGGRSGRASPLRAARPEVRLTGRIFAGVVLATTGVYAGVTVTPVVASEITGSATLAGLPVAALLAGAGGGAGATAALIRRYGRRAAAVGSYAVGCGACLVAAVATNRATFLLLLAGLLGVGAGHAANQMARYGAAELHPPARRPSVIGWVVWAQAVGAVAGPLLLGPVTWLALRGGLSGATGAFLIGAALFAVTAILHALGPSWGKQAPSSHASGAAAGGVSLRALPAVRAGAVALITAQVVMLLVMTMTPLHARHAGHGLGAVGLVMSAHTFGMFGLAPLAGRLVKRAGSRAVIAAGLALLGVGAAAAAVTPPAWHLVLGGALLLLGLGWSLAFVAASALLSEVVAPQVRATLQARVEALTWTSGAAASVASGVLLGLVGYRLLCLLGVLLLLPAAVVTSRRRAATVTPQPAVQEDARPVA